MIFYLLAAIVMINLTGGRGADKFICGEGADVIKDYNAKEGDTILDKQNCETM